MRLFFNMEIDADPVLKETLKVIWLNLYIFMNKEPYPSSRNFPRATETGLDPHLVTQCRRSSIILCCSLPTPRQHVAEATHLNLGTS